MTPSYAAGPDIPLLDRTIGQQLQAVAGRIPDGLALVSRHQGIRLSWRELLDAADRVAGGMAALGLRPQDRVGVWATNCAEWIVLHLACARAGIVLVNVNPACRTHELSFVLGRSGMKALFLWERDDRVSYRDVLAEVRRDGQFALRHAIEFGSGDWEAVRSATPAAPAEVNPDEPTNIQYTSGTTGSPKGVLLTHRNIMNNGYLIARTLRYTEGDRICVPVPLSHCFGNVIGTMASVASGAAMILPNRTFDAGLTLAAVEAERATSLYGVPTMFIAELRHPDFKSFDLSSLRTGVMAGAPCPVEVMKSVRQDMHCEGVTIAYGLTETSPVLTMSQVDDSPEIRVSTVGAALPCTELTVAAVASDEILPRGVQGEIRARGYAVMKGYDGEPEATARSINPEGWFRTGDLGVMRDDGYVQITGRAKDMIIRGGENIYPREVEEFLYTHPAVAEVHVAGLPDERLGEIVLAWIRLKPGAAATAEEVREFCRGQIAYFKIPESIRFVEWFPTTLSGKIQKYRIREMELEMRAAT